MGTKTVRTCDDCKGELTAQNAVVVENSMSGGVSNLAGYSGNDGDFCLRCFCKALGLTYPTTTTFRDGVLR